MQVKFNQGFGSLIKSKLNRYRDRKMGRVEAVFASLPLDKTSVTLLSVTVSVPYNSNWAIFSSASQVLSALGCSATLLSAIVETDLNGMQALMIYSPGILTTCATDQINTPGKSI